MNGSKVFPSNAHPQPSAGSDTHAGSSQEVPLIGISTYQQPASWSKWHSVEATLLPAEYSQMVTAAGGIPVLLPPQPGTSVALQRLDGLLLAGGADIGAGLYGQEPHPTTQSQDYRDLAEAQLFKTARTLGLPVLGICRGMQLINVLFGGTLHQHLPQVLGHDRYQPGPGVYGCVDVACQADSLAHNILGDTLTAPCYHHQGVDRVGEGLRASASSPDGVVQTLELAKPDHAAWLFAVQWHPEHNPHDQRVMGAFVQAAREYSQTRDSSQFHHPITNHSFKGAQ